MINRVIFHIENRGAPYIFHWFIYMIAGLRHLKTGGSVGNDGSGKFEKNKNLFDINSLKPPYNLYFSTDLTGIFSLGMTNYQIETFELLKDEYNIINKNDIREDDIVLNNYGEYITNTEYHIPKEGYEFLRNFENKIIITPDDIVKYRKNFYVCRSKSHLLEGNQTDSGIKRRQIVNEYELTEELQKNNIEILFLEDLSLIEKIKLFKIANTIISPNSGALTFTLFSSTTKIVELNVQNPVQISRQYEDQCKCFNIPYYKYVCDKVDGNDNMKINTQHFVEYIKKIIIT